MTTIQNQVTKIVFLDIDGVLNSTDSVHVSLGPTEATSEKVRQLGCVGMVASFALKHADPVSIALFNRLLDETGAGLVLSSSHRMNFSELGYGSVEHLQKLRNFLNAMGVNVPEFFCITPRAHAIRGKQIELWLAAFDGEVSYVILDDGRDFNENQPLVWCDPKYGFTFEEYREASNILGTNVSSILLA